MLTLRCAHPNYCHGCTILKHSAAWYERLPPWVALVCSTCPFDDVLLNTYSITPFTSTCLNEKQIRRSNCERPRDVKSAVLPHTLGSATGDRTHMDLCPSSRGAVFLKDHTYTKDKLEISRCKYFSTNSRKRACIP
jgi:hypothetical protein